MWIGFDLGGTKMLAVAYSDSLEPRARVRRKTSAASDPASVDRLIGVLRDAVEEAGVQHDKLKGIGVGCPAAVDLKRGVLIDAPNLGWQDVPLQERLEREFGCPVRLANDVDAGLYGEYCFGVARGARCALGVFPGTGIGGALVYEGKIFRGSRSSCMEIGHLPVVADGPLCGCGRSGCLEAVASRLAVSSAAARAAFRGDAPRLAAEAGTDLRNIKSRALRVSIAAGDGAVEEIVRSAARAIGTSIGGVINLLAPDIVVLGGGLVEALPDLFLEEVRRAAAARALPFHGEALRVEAALLGDDATALGAAAWVRDEVGS